MNDNYWEQLDLFHNAELRDKMMKMDATVDDIQRRFGFYSIQRGLMLGDTILSAVNAKERAYGPSTWLLLRTILHLV